MRALYEDSAVPVRDIAAMAGVTERTIYKYAARDRWKPRYRWNAHGARPQAKPRRAGDTYARRRETARLAQFAPAKGAGGRFIRRADKGKPFASGLKATDPAGAARAAAQCDLAARAAADAQEEAELLRRIDERSRAWGAVNRALDRVIRHREACGRRGADRTAEGDDPLEGAYWLAVDAAMDWVTSLRDGDGAHETGDIPPPHPVPLPLRRAPGI